MELEPLEVGDLDETAFRVAALLGVQDPGATVLTLVPDAEIARRIAATLSESHLVAGLPDPGITGDESGEELWNQRGAQRV